MTTETKEYPGKCHCQRIKFVVTLAPLETKTVFDCNCTSCRMHGLNVTHCRRRDLRVTTGNEFLSEPYMYIAEDVGFKFCTKCGTGLFYDVIDPTETDKFIAVNVRALEGVDIDKVKLTFYNGLDSNLDKVPIRSY